MQGLQGQEELDRCGHCSFADGLHNTVSQGVHQYFVATVAFSGTSLAQTSYAQMLLK
jgi:hypothetical protein